MIILLVSDAFDFAQHDGALANGALAIGIEYTTQ
jgi:hypothetical protein